MIAYMLGRVLSIVRSWQKIGSWRRALAAMPLFAALVAPNSLQTANANGDTRALIMYHNHTRERIDIIYKRDGRYDDEALKKIDWFLRDWRKGRSVQMDPQLLDLVWEVYHELGASSAIRIICGYRDEGTNSMLRSRSNGVAQHSQHTQGRAMDIAIPGVPTAKLRELGMLKQKGGVGYYPSSGFVHLDVSNVRAWPRMNTQQLVQLFPHGETLHLPSDGPPLPGYQLALAKLGRDGKRGGDTMLAFADRRGGDFNTSMRGVLNRFSPPSAEITQAMQIAAYAPATRPAPVPMPRPFNDTVAGIVSTIQVTPHGAPRPVARPVGLMMASLQTPQIYKINVQFTALRYDMFSTKDFFNDVSAKRKIGLTAPAYNFAAAHFTAPLAAKDFSLRKLATITPTYIRLAQK